MSFDRIVKGGKVFTADDSREADVAIKDGKIAAIGKNLPADGAEVLDASGLWVIPGGVDVHVHFQLRVAGTVSADDFENGTKSAACGGVTTVVDFSTQGPRDDTLLAGVEARLKEAEGKACVDFGLHAGISAYKRLKDPAADLRRLLDFGVPSVKMFMIYEQEGWQSDDADIFSALRLARGLGATVCVHAESERVMNLLIAEHRAQKERLGAWAHALSRPNFIEEEAVQRALKWAEATGGHLYVVHLSTGGGADLFKQAQARGVNAHVETCPQYLLLNDEVFKDKKTGHWYATCPQIKKKADNERLWQGLADGTIAVVSTDTCPFTTKQKDAWNGDFTKIPYGLPGVETLLPALYTFGVKAGRFGMNHFVSLISTNPAKLMGLYPQKGAIAVGSDADLAMFDPDAVRTIDSKELVSRCDWSPYQGLTMGGFPVHTLSRGEPVVRNGKFVGPKGHGRFLKRRPFGWKDLPEPRLVPPSGGR
ncbi:MAG TPA: dihydropyrimidinase [Elusimicrobiota bacterium]|nr:dihydropyrimidinase [Elusimicrobiota bacterium]